MHLGKQSCGDGGTNDADSGTGAQDTADESGTGRLSAALLVASVLLPAAPLLSIGASWETLARLADSRAVHSATLRLDGKVPSRVAAANAVRDLGGRSLSLLHILGTPAQVVPRYVTRDRVRML